MTFLAVVFVLIFSFAFVVGDARPAAPVTSGILWIALVVSGTVGLGRTFDREREGEGDPLAVALAHGALGDLPRQARGDESRLHAARRGRC